VNEWGSHAALAPGGPQGSRLAAVFWVFFLVVSAVYVIVMALLAAAVVRRQETPDWARRARIIAGGGALTAVILLALLAVTISAGKGMAAFADGPVPLVVRVTAHQWWWEFQYLFDPPSQIVTTANELHIPVNTRVRLELVATDVIHSFWVPSLHGKRDLIPGHPSTTVIQADRAGVYRGQCAEFCGLQHALMGFVVRAEDAATFQAWLEAQRRPAPEPSGALASRGREVFLRGPCVMCHAVAGTVAGAHLGPDLTHVAARGTIGAGTLVNTHEHLLAWVKDAQALKPGARMPTMPLAPAELESVLAYLEQLR
jgi:cytochrome c oxidase subunit 2